MGEGEMDGIWRERTRVDEQEGCKQSESTKMSNHHRTLSTSNGLLNKHATLVETPPSRNSCSQVFWCSGRRFLLLMGVVVTVDVAVMAGSLLDMPISWQILTWF